MKKIISVCIILLGLTYSADAQVLISLLFGDKLNSDKVEFGLAVGPTYSRTTVPESSNGLAGLGLGFYFDFWISERWSIAPSCLVVSRMGASNIAPYPLDPDFDPGFVGGKVTRKLEYFQVPVLMRYDLSDRFYTSFGPQFSLLSKATDEFSNSIVNRNDLTYKNTITDLYKRIDVGASLNLGYKLKKEPKSMSIGAVYYQGLIDILKDNGGDAVYNNSLFVYITIPVGAGKSKEEDN